MEQVYKPVLRTLGGKCLIPYPNGTPASNASPLPPASWSPTLHPTNLLSYSFPFRSLFLLEPRKLEEEEQRRRLGGNCCVRLLWTLGPSRSCMGPQSVVYTFIPVVPKLTVAVVSFVHSALPQWCNCVRIAGDLK